MHKQRDGYAKGKFNKTIMSYTKRRILYGESIFDTFTLQGRPVRSGMLDLNANLFNYEHRGGNILKIKFKNYEIKEQMSKNNKPFKMVHVNGTAEGGKLDGQDYTCKFFGSNKDLLNQIKECNPGDMVDIKMAKNGNYWNPVSFTSEGPETAASSAGGSGASPIVNQRFENLALAVEILGAIPSDKDAFEYLQDAASIADMIQGYIDEKGAFQFANTSEEIPGDDDGEDEG